MSTPIVLSHPWRDDKGKLHEVGESVSVDDAIAENLVRGGIGVAAKGEKAEAKK